LKQESGLAAADREVDLWASPAASYGLAAGEDLPPAWARAQMNAPDESDAELSAVKYYLLQQWVLGVREKSLYEGGVNDRPLTEVHVTSWVSTLGNETAQRWWMAEHGRALLLTPELRDAVDAKLRDLGPAHRSAHRRLLEQMRSGPLPGEDTPPVTSLESASPSIAATQPAQ
jgi:hypothetical protein